VGAFCRLEVLSLLMDLGLEPFFLSQKKVQTPKKCSWSNMGRCPIPHPLFEKSGAKTFMCGYAAALKFLIDGCSFGK
jgi:hypothetical protein